MTVDAGQHQARNHRGGEQRADRFVQDIGQQNQDQARRDDLAERAGGADHAAGQALVVTAPQHAGQREQPERHHRGADDAGGRAHQHADQHDADAEAAAQRAGGMADHVHQVLGQPRPLQHHAHEDEQRDRQQRRVGDHAEDAVRQQIEQQRAEADDSRTPGRKSPASCRPECPPAAGRRTTPASEREDFIRTSGAPVSDDSS